MTKLLNILLILAFAVAAYADPITMADLPYMCDFENAAENANWGLNPKIENFPTIKNRWVIGSAMAYTGRNGLYVSGDDGKTNTYAQTNNVLLAYRDITLEMGDYDIAYDWRGMGNKTKGYLKVIFANVPNVGNRLSCLANNVEPEWVANSIALMGKNTSLMGADAWYHVQARVTIPKSLQNKTTTRILFVWVNTDVNPAQGQVMESVVIDNFQLAKAAPNDDYPRDIFVSTQNNVATVSWTGNADSYEILYRPKDADDFNTATSDTCSVDLKNIPYGAYEFWICCINGTDKTLYTVFPTIYIYQTDCFDVLNMYGATFEYGTWSYNNSKGVVKEVAGTDKVDFGPSDIRSRHTTHFSKTEVDPRTVVRRNRDTLACLKTIPDGEYGSFRLGNWNSNFEYESVSFKHKVENNSTAVLLIHYAMVLENPYHFDTEQPRFTLDVLDENGDFVDLKCASVDFHAPTTAEWYQPRTREIWHESQYEGHTIHWQDWRTIGISVAEYIGQTLTITFTSYDCGQGAHFGYAYFMLNCNRIDVEGLPWGEGSVTQQFTAPGGFDYAWFNELDTLFKDTVWTEQTFYVSERDTNKYVCHVSYPTNPDCGFEFRASAKPHNPIAEIQWEWQPNQCTNGYFIRNASHIGLTNQITGEIDHEYSYHPDYCIWTMPDGSTTTDEMYDGFFVPVPNEGDTVTYGMEVGVYINDTVYKESGTFTVFCPAIGPLETHQYDTICRGDMVEFPVGTLKWRTETGEYRDSLTSVVTGCDSTVFLHLFVHEPVYYEFSDTICHEDKYFFAGEYKRSSGDYTATLTSKVTGCDSVLTLHLTKAPRPRVILNDADICGDEPLRFSTTGVRYADSIVVSVPGQDDFVYPARRDNFEFEIAPGLVRANKYEAQIITYMTWCDPYVDTLTFNIDLASTVVEAKYDGLLALKNEKYNGGYKIVEYKWFLNGKRIDDHDKSYIYTTHISDNDVYTLEVKLSDGTELMVCPFTYAELREAQKKDDNSAQPSAPQKVIMNGQLYIITDHAVYNCRGQIQELNK